MISMWWRLMDFIAKLQELIILLLTWVMAVVLIITAVELVWTLFQDVILNVFGLQMKELLNFFGTILLVLIGVELLETLKGYEMDKTFNVQIVFLLALIALARNVILLELEDITDCFKLSGFALIIFSLSISYYLIKKSDNT
ncbi:MAG: phosphate-starvation-inducible PsiE family protein [Methanotrichaceae archaeon]|nr:phosphate-starvation-inducible PsiE family protein [Methanotrichaceae archaeon]